MSVLKSARAPNVSCMSRAVFPSTVEFTSVIPTPLSPKRPVLALFVLMSLAWFEKVSVDPVCTRTPLPWLSWLLMVLNPGAPEKTEEIVAMVDTGAAFSWIHRERLERVGAQVLRRMGFRAIDGSIIERDTAAVWVGSDGFSGPDTVVIAERSDVEVIGAHTIEGLGLAADPVQKKLVPTIGLALTAGKLEAKS